MEALKYGNGVINSCFDWEPSANLLKNKIIYKPDQIKDIEIIND